MSRSGTSRERLVAGLASGVTVAEAAADAGIGPIPAAPGPLLIDDAKWFVVAFDAQGIPIANSVMRPVAP